MNSSYQRCIDCLHFCKDERGKICLNAEQGYFYCFGVFGVREEMDICPVGFEAKPIPEGVLPTEHFIDTLRPL